MRSRGIVLSLLSAMVLVLFGPAASAPAAIAFHGVTTAHAAGMPVATEPWRTLVEGGIDVETSFNTWTATARLGGAIPAGESVQVSWMTGRRTDTGCTPIVTFVADYATASEDHTVTTMRTTFDPEDTIDPSDPTPICFRISLRAGGIVSDVLEGGLTVDEASAAIIGLDGSATEHEVGYPKSTEAWRTLTAGAIRGDVVSGDLRLSATLGGPVPAGASYTVGWYVGRQQPNGCEPLGTQFAATDAPLDSGNSMSVEYGAPDDFASEFSCFEVGLFTSDGQDDLHSDHLVGQVSPIVADVTVEAAPAAEQIVVAAGRSTPVIVTASSRVGAAKGLTLFGRGRTARAARTSTGTVEPRQTRPVIVRVGATSPGRSRLRLTARDPRFDVARSTRSWPVVARRIEAQRPRPGRYESADGGVAFRVTRDFVVRGLRVDDVDCEGTSSLASARLGQSMRLPRNGAAARVVRSTDRTLGLGFLGAQVLTTSPRRLVGTFTVATQRCTGSVRIAAVRQG